MDLNRNNIRKIIFIACVIITFAYALFHFENVQKLFNWTCGLIMPFVIGFAAAFIINVPMKSLENVLFKNKNSKLYPMKRIICMILALVLVAFIITFAIVLIIPEVSRTVSTIGTKFPGAMEKAKAWGIGLMDGHPEIVEKIKGININWSKISDQVVDVIKNGGNTILVSTFTFASSVVTSVINLVVGIFFALYILAQKETLEKQCKGILFAFCKEEKADKIIRVFAMADSTFTSFIAGQCLEAFILGMMFFVSMAILKIPFALVISITIAITALIPVLGSFIGCGIGAFLILVDDPKKVIMFLVLFIILQQIEGNFIYPHVVGGSVGLPSIWVLMAVVLGGNMMGVVGMIVFVPGFSVIYSVLEEYVVKKIREKNIPWVKYGTDYVLPSRKKRRLEKKNKKKAERAQTANEAAPAVTEEEGENNV